jgi:hypothetical protein
MALAVTSIVMVTLCRVRLFVVAVLVSELGGGVCVCVGGGGAEPVFNLPRRAWVMRRRRRWHGQTSATSSAH